MSTCPRCGYSRAADISTRVLIHNRTLLDVALDEDCSQENIQMMVMRFCRKVLGMKAASLSSARAQAMTYLDRATGMLAPLKPSEAAHAP